MSARSTLGLLFLHALPFDGSMWAAHEHLLPGASTAPTLYGSGDSLEHWAREALKVATSDRLIVVGCSVGGSCALEVAAAAPDRVSALVLIGTKARHRPDPAFMASALDTIEKGGLSLAWTTYWAPLFSESSDPAVVEAAKCAARRQEPADIARGITAFHSRRSLDSFVAGCRVPITVVTGEEDVAPGPTLSAELAASAERGSLHVIPSCGHYVPLEQPGALNEILDDVISRHA